MVFRQLKKMSMKNGMRRYGITSSPGDIIGKRKNPGYEPNVTPHGAALGGSQDHLGGTLTCTLEG